MSYINTTSAHELHEYEYEHKQCCVKAGEEHPESCVLTM